MEGSGTGGVEGADFGWGKGAVVDVDVVDGATEAVVVLDDWMIPYDRSQQELDV